MWAKNRANQKNVGTRFVQQYIKLCVFWHLQQHHILKSPFYQRTDTRVKKEIKGMSYGSTWLLLYVCIHVFYIFDLDIEQTRGSVLSNRQEIETHDRRNT